MTLKLHAYVPSKIKNEMKTSSFEYPKHPGHYLDQSIHSTSVNCSESFKSTEMLFLSRFPSFLLPAVGYFHHEALLLYYMCTYAFFFFQTIVSDYYILNPNLHLFSVNVETWLVLCIRFLSYDLTIFIYLKIFDSFVLYVANHAIYKQRILIFSLSRYKASDIC